MPADDIAAAAGRLAAHARYATGDMRPVQSADLVALRPFLEALAAGQDEAGRVERWARALRSAKGLRADATVYAGDTPCPAWMLEVGTARAAIALADAERVAQTARAPVAWRARTVNGLGWAYLTEHEQGVTVGPEWEPLYAGQPERGGDNHG